MDGFPALPVQSYAALRQHIQSGDILLCSGSSLFSTLIQQATHSIWSHVAFILRLDAIDRIMVLESVESIGVRTVPLSSYLNDYNGTGTRYPGQLMLARHADIQADCIKNLSKHAIDLLGHPYHTQEILHIAARIGRHNMGLANAPVVAPSQQAFICSEYAYICFKSIGITIDYDPEGYIAPADFARCTKLKPVAYIENAVAKPKVSHDNILQRV